MIAEAIGVALQSADLVVGALQRPRGNRELEIVEDAPGVLPQGAGELLQDADLGSHRPGTPGGQEFPGRPPVRLFPQLSQVFLEVIGRGQRGIQFQGLVQAFRSFRLVQVFGVLEQQPAGAFEHVLVQFVGRLAEEFSSQVGELLVEQFDDVEVIEHDLGLGQLLADRLDVGGRHVHGHRLDLGPGSAQSPPKRLQRLAAFALADEHHGPALQIQDDRQVAVAACRSRSRRWPAVAVSSASPS